MYLFALIAAAVLNGASPAPSSAPSPGVAPPVTLAGISLGEDIGAALRGMPLAYNPTPHGITPDPDKVQEVTINMGPAGQRILWYDTVVRQISVIADSRSEFPDTDPYGVAIGDSEARLKELRGDPALIDDHGFWFYVVDGKIRWIYQFLNGAVVQISVDDLIGHQ